MTEDAFFSTLATLVKCHRKQAGLSQKELADYAGVGKTVVYDMEHGKRTIQLQTAFKILAVLNINVRFDSPLQRSDLTDEKGKGL